MSLHSRRDLGGPRPVSGRLEPTPLCKTGDYEKRPSAFTLRLNHPAHSVLGADRLARPRNIAAAGTTVERTASGMSGTRPVLQRAGSRPRRAFRTKDN